jgi:very-short-patch-repair endonuclease
MSSALAIVHRRADKRLGVASRNDLRRAGLTDRQISVLVRKGLLIRVHRAVFRLPGAPVTLKQRALAATIAVGQPCVVSHWTAADLWGLIPSDQKRAVEVTIPRGRTAAHSGVVVHTASHLPRTDVTELIPVPITRVPRTIADLRGDTQEAALDEAIRRRLTTPADVLGYSRALNKLALDRLGLGTPHEKIERLAIAALRAYGLPDAVRQYEICPEGKTYYIDLAYPDERVAIELLGESAHWGTDRFQYEIDRRNAIELAGFRLLEFTWWDVNERPERLGRQVSAALAGAKRV